MKIFHLPDMTPRDRLPSGCVAALGFFDGVHSGHRELFRRAAGISPGAPVVAWTFFSGARERLLTDDGTRFRLLGEAGAEYVAAEDFDALRSLSGEEFVNDVLVKELGASAAVCGESFRFGRGASSDSGDLLSFCRAAGLGCSVVPSVKKDGEVVSSSRIRALIEAGDAEGAARLLGREHFYSLPVVRGKRLAGELGFPTLNQLIPKNLVVPGRGVYVCRVFLGDGEGGAGQALPGVGNVGVCPTVDEKELENFRRRNPSYVLPDRELVGAEVFETHVIGDTGDLYGKTVRVSLVKKLRDERKFDSLDDLVRAVEEDGRRAAEYFEKSGA